MGLKILGPAPTTATEATPRSYVDTAARMLAVTPQIGWGLVDATCVSTTTGAALTSGRCNFHRLYFGPGTYDALFVNVVSAQVTGTVSLLAGLYPDDGSGSWPDTSAAAPVAQVDPANPFTLTTAGARIGLLQTPLVVTKPTLLWAASLYLVTSTPMSSPTLTATSGNLNNLGRSINAVGFATLRGYYSTGLSALPVSAARTTSTITASGSTDITAVGARRSA